MNLTQAILSLRLTINDTATSHYAAPDNMESQIDQLRKVFKLSNRNILTGLANSFFIQDSAAPVTADVTDPVNGLVTMASIPQSSLEWYYYYQDFTDAEVQQFLDQGLGEVGMDETALDLIPVGLFTVVSLFASALANGNRLKRFAETFTSAVEGESFQTSDIYKAYKVAHDTDLKDATDKRQEFYQKQGRRFQTYSRTQSQNYRPPNLFPRR